MKRSIFSFIALRSVKYARFIPPWEREGKSPDEFFSGLMQSKNPIQRKRKEQEKENAEKSFSSTSPEVERRIMESIKKQNELKEVKRNFLPYGASPQRYFSSTQMAAWGEYQKSMESAITASSEIFGRSETFDGYSPEVTALLQQEMENKIPVSFSECPPKKGQNPRWPFHGTAGVVLDIDGVVYRSHQKIEGSDTAIKLLQKLKIPFIFMTNGGGVTEEVKAKILSEYLNCEISADQIVLAHSPIRFLAPLYANSTVLVAGPPECENVARAYGFKNPISIQRFQCEHPELVPYKDWRGLVKAEPHVNSFPPISAILGLTDLTDPMSDIQVIVDVLLSPFGQIGTAVSAEQTIPYYHCGDDLLWATEAVLPRLGNGAIREMLFSVFQSLTGNSLQMQVYGKPRSISFAYAEKQLKVVSERLGWDPSCMRNIFMVGDNLETDILGANARDGLWTSVHVLSGIGSAPAALRSLINGDEEQVWLEQCVSKTPHYIAPTLDHFVRELLSFPEEMLSSMKTPYFGRPNPVNLKEMYNFS